MNRKLRDIIVSVPQQLKPHPVSSTEVVNDIMLRGVWSKQQYDKRASPQPLKSFSRNDQVFVKPNPKNKHKPWIYGQVIKNRGHRSCVVNMAVGLIQRNHKQLQKAEVTPQAFNKTNQEELEIISLPDETYGNNRGTSNSAVSSSGTHHHQLMSTSLYLCYIQ